MKCWSLSLLPLVTCNILAELKCGVEMALLQYAHLFSTNFKPPIAEVHGQILPLVCALLPSKSKKMLSIHVFEA